MRFFRSEKNFPSSLHNAVIVIGNFDGFHIGHQAIAQKASEIARKESRALVLLTFEPHPASFFRPHKEGFLITSTRTKIRAFSQYPFDAVVFLPFNAKMASLSAFSFVKDILVTRLHAGHIVAGEDFGFGLRREGNAVFLKEHFPFLPLTLVEKLKDKNGEIVSSSRIRAFLQDGNVRCANELMKRPFEIEGYVVHGFARGRQIGFPTANITTLSSIVPKKGVYVAKVLLGDCEYKSVVNIGQRPTVNGKDVWLEAHLLNVDMDLYGKRLRILLTDFIRPEKRFASLDELKQNIALDCKKASEILS